MRILSNADVEQSLDLDGCMAALEAAYRELALDQAANRPRNHTFFPVEDEDHPGFRFRFKSQEGGNRTAGVWATRITSDMAGLEALPNGGRRRRLIPAAPGNTFVGLVTLYSLKTLEPLAIIHDSVMQKLRVGATSALGIRELSNPGATVAGLFGSGWQAGSHLEFLLRVRPSVEEIRVHSPTAHHREAFCEEWAARSGRRVVPVAEPRQAVAGCQLVICATATVDPCFDGAWLEPGTHVTSITSPDGTMPPRRELDDTTFDRADRVVVLSKEQIEHDNQIDILGPVQRGTKSWDDIGELGALLAGRSPGRTGPDQVTVFANNTGMGLQFAAVGSVVLRNAEAKGLGREVPTAWFLEDTTP